MMRSLFSGVSGLRNHQTRMDVIGNNIANVNTVGFKRDRVNFQDIFYQMLQAPSAATGARGSTVGQYVGVGMGIGSIDTFHTQGSVMYTGNPLDLMIQGDGYFILGEIDDTDSDSVIDPTELITNKHYTRAGVFGVSIGTVDTGTAGQQQHALLVDKATGMYVVGYVNTGGDGSRDFDTTTGFPNEFGSTTTNWRLGPIDLGDPTRIASYSIDDNGFVVVLDTNDNKHTVARLALAKFPNPEGLEKVGENLFLPTPASGNAVRLVDTHSTGDDEPAGIPGVSSLGTLVPGSLEMSNVELAQEFTDMITTQRGFQANARTITVSDEMLQELVNLKR